MKAPVAPFLAGTVVGAVLALALAGVAASGVLDRLTADDDRNHGTQLVERDVAAALYLGHSTRADVILATLEAEPRVHDVIASADGTFAIDDLPVGTVILVDAEWFVTLSGAPGPVVDGKPTRSENASFAAKVSDAFWIARSDLSVVVVGPRAAETLQTLGVATGGMLIPEGHDVAFAASRRVGDGGQTTLFGSDPSNADSLRATLPHALNYVTGG